MCIMTTGKHRLTLFLNPELIVHARAEAVVQKCSLTELMEKALLEYLPNETVIKKPIIR